METIKCKFCKEDVIYNKVSGRHMNIDGKSYHSKTCKNSMEYHKARAAEIAETKRKSNTKRAKRRKPQDEIDRLIWEGDRIIDGFAADWGLVEDSDDYNAGCRDDY